MVDPTDAPNAGVLEWDVKDQELYSQADAIEAAIPAGVRHLVELEADASTVLSTLSDTGLEFPVVAGVFRHWLALIAFRQSDVTNGVGFSVLGPGTTPAPVDWLHYQTYIPVSVGSISSSTGSIYDATQFNNSIPPVSGSEVGDYLAVMQGTIVPPSSGVLKIRFRQEVASASAPMIIRAGSALEWW